MESSDGTYFKEKSFFLRILFMKKKWDRIGYHLLRYFSLFLRKLPPTAAVRIGRALGELSYFLSSTKRKSVAYADIKAVLGPRFSEGQRRQMIKRHYGYLGELFADLLCFPNMTRETMRRTIRVHHESRYLNTLAENKGVIVITGHFGNWELLQLVSNVYYDRPVHLIAAAQKHNLMNDFLNSLRSCHGSSVITRGRGMGIRAIFRVLKQNKVTGILGDQDAGKKGGIIVPFLGRKTTIPTGAFELALRTGAPIFPCFLVRTDGPKHELFMAEPIWCRPAQDSQLEIKQALLKFVKLLEDMILTFPEQWLWGVKRWKYSWTKRLLILSNGRSDSFEETQKVIDGFQKVQTQYGRPGMEYPTQTIRVYFKSAWHKRLFPLFAVLFIPHAQGRLAWLKIFFKPETQKALEKSSADFVISDDPSLAPLNLCLAKDSKGKCIVTKKARFPFNLFSYDLAVPRAADLSPEHLQKML